ncbi:sugar phosphate isomerase/epimerase family protein [Portibacter marinus]|uniref:sugar phosphate isomerase/epimerase family protein n=1 Tax=Portibacter marinus TaxID=2898660 RepID=UPI001F2225A5|nr:sugar phosphate isomerase/epimerase [Portibacter marinus]
MKIAIHNWMRAEPLQTTIQRIAEMGYDQIEIQGSPEMYDTAEVKAILEDYEIECWGSVTLMLEQRNLLAKNEAQRKMSIQYVKDIAKMVSDLGGSVISLVPSTVGKIIPEGTPDEDWDNAYNSIKEIYKYTEGEGVKIAIEPINRFETYFINRGDQALVLAEAIGPNCGVCLDTFHMNIEEDNPYEAMKRVGDRLFNFHVADNNRMAPGMGTIDWKKTISTLREIGYNKTISVEFCSPLDRTPANPYPHSIDENPEGLSREQKKFLEDHGSSAVTEEFYSMLTSKSIETLKAHL